MMNKSTIWRESRSQADTGWQQHAAPKANAEALDKMIGRRLKSCYAESQPEYLPHRLSELLLALDQTDEQSDMPRRR